VGDEIGGINLHGPEGAGAMGRTRRRSIPFQGPNTVSYEEYRGSPGQVVPNAIRRFSDNNNVWKGLIGTQVTTSENHPGWNSRDEGSTGDIGGNFTSTKSWVEYPRNSEPQTINSGWYPYLGIQRRDRWYGPIYASTQPPPASARSSESELAALGTTAIARCAPTNSLVSLSTALTELYHEGIPALLGSPIWERRARNLKDVYNTAGDEYLKVQFGWKPLISDITGVASVISRSNRLLRQLERDSGKVVRRRYTFPPIRTITETKQDAFPSKLGGHDAPAMWVPNPKMGKQVHIHETSINRWFSGAFTYYLPEVRSSILKHALEADRLLGLSLDPEVLWNVTPWSWAVDWFSNVGDVIHNVNSFAKYGLVLKYAYIMEHSIVSDTYDYFGPQVFANPVMPEVFKVVTETKIRRQATPFGFGLTMGGLTTAQKAIVAALGLSRA